MRVLMVLVLALVGLFGTGCTATSQANLQQSVLSHSVGIQVTTAMTTKLALLGVPTKDRAKATSDVHTVAVAIQSALRVTNPTVADLKQFALGLAAKSNSPYVEIVSTLIDGGIPLVDAYLIQYYQTVSADQRAAAALQLMRSVIDGIAAGSGGVISIPSPTTMPTAQNYLTLPKRLAAPSPFTDQLPI